MLRLACCSEIFSEATSFGPTDLSEVNEHWKAVHLQCEFQHRILLFLLERSRRLYFKGDEGISECVKLLLIETLHQAHNIRSAYPGLPYPHSPRSAGFQMPGCSGFVSSGWLLRLSQSLQDMRMISSRVHLSRQQLISVFAGLKASPSEFHNLFVTKLISTQMGSWPTCKWSQITFTGNRISSSMSQEHGGIMDAATCSAYGWVSASSWPRDLNFHDRFSLWSSHTIAPNAATGWTSAYSKLIWALAFTTTSEDQISTQNWKSCPSILRFPWFSNKT